MDEFERRQITVAADLGIEEKKKMQPRLTAVKRRFEARKHGVDLLAERDAIVVGPFVPFLDDAPYRARVRTGARARRMRRQPDDLHAAFHDSPEKAPPVVLQRLRIRRVAQQAGRHLRPAAGMVVNGVDVKVGLEPARAGDLAPPLVRCPAFEVHRPSPSLALARAARSMTRV